MWAGARIDPLLGLAAGGVCLAIPVARNAVRSYRTVSPLPPDPATRFGGLFSVALSVGPQPAGRRIEPVRRFAALDFPSTVPLRRGKPLRSFAARTFLTTGQNKPRRAATSDPHQLIIRTSQGKVRRRRAFLTQVAVRLRFRPRQRALAQPLGR